MAWWDQEPNPQPATGEDYGRALEQRTTPLGSYLGAQFGQGFAGTLPGLTLFGYTAPQAPYSATGEPNPQFAEGFATMPPPENGERAIGADEFKAVVGDRPIPVDPFATRQRAEALRDAKDDETWRAWLIQQRHAGPIGGTLGFGASMAAGFLDPVNYLPIAGPAWRWAEAAEGAGRAAMILRRAAVGAGETAALSAVELPLQLAHARELGDDVTFAGVTRDLLTGAAIGGLLGGLHGVWATRGGARVPGVPEVERPAAAADEAAPALALAVDDVLHDRPVDATAAGPAAFDVGTIVPRRAGEARATEAASSDLGPALDRYLNPQPDGTGALGTPHNTLLRDPAAYRAEMRARGWSDERIAAREDVLRGDVRALDASMTPAPAPLTLYRGERPYEGGGIPKVGEVVERPELLSTTANPRVAETAAMPGVLIRPLEKPGPRVVYEIEAPAGTRMLSRRDAASNEREAILARGTRLRVREVTRDGETVRVKAEALPAGHAADRPSPPVPEPDPAAVLKAELAKPEAWEPKAAPAKMDETGTGPVETPPISTGEAGQARPGSDFPELLDYEAALAAGRVPDAARAEVAAATAAADKATTLDAAYRQAASCFLGATG